MPYTGRYKLEVWGASGGGNDSNAGSTTDAGLSGKGGYSTGILSTSKNANLYAYVGGQGKCLNTQTAPSATFNGGGSGYRGDGTDPSCSGGGATDVSVYSGAWNSENHLYSRIIVAGGGGGGGDDIIERGGHGGGTSGVVATTGGNGYGLGGTQLAGGSYVGNTASVTVKGTNGSFGTGANGTSGAPTWTNSGSGGGGGGWYGGGSASVGSGGGGSGWVYTSSTYSNWKANSTEGKSNKWKLNTGYYLASASTTAGDQTFKSPSNVNETGHLGSGYVKITWLGV